MTPTTVSEIFLPHSLVSLFDDRNILCRSIIPYLLLLLIPDSGVLKQRQRIKTDVSVFVVLFMKRQI